MWRLTRLLSAIALTALIALVAGCSGDDAYDGRTLHRGLGPDAESLDPQRARTVQAANVLRDIGEGLVTHAAGGNLEPGTAERWEVSADGLVYTFTLRNGARWSNGEAVTAAHFVAGFRRLVDPAIGAFYAQLLDDVVNATEIVEGDAPVASLGVQALDTQTLEIRLERPVPYLLNLLTHHSTYPVYVASGEAHADATPADGPFNGAYTVASRDVGSLLRLERNDDYWNDQNTAIDRVFWHVAVQEMSELNRYRSGELHITSNVPPRDFEAIRSEFGDALRVAPYLGVYYYGFNLSREPFKSKPSLRQALSMAIDRDVIVERIIGRGEAAALSFVPPGTHDYDPPRLSFAALDQSERNAIARRLYAEAGYGEDNPLEIELRYNTSDTQERIAVAVQSMWRDVLGVRTRLVNQEFQVLLAAIRERSETEVFRASWIADYNDAHSFLALMTTGNPSNMPGYSNDEFDELMRRAAARVDPRRRRLYLEEAERVLLADHAVIPLYFYISKHLVSPDVGGWQDNVLDYHYSRHLDLRGGATP